jgi:hypothetical protein
MSGKEGLLEGVTITTVVVDCARVNSYPIIQRIRERASKKRKHYVPELEVVAPSQAQLLQENLIRTYETRPTCVVDTVNDPYLILRSQLREPK